MAASAESQEYSDRLGERVAALEANKQHLATKEDIANLRLLIVLGMIIAASGGIPDILALFAR
ncbi:MAG: hypothetical protein OXG85_01595 [Chloroflexi bacterium]|nr:hypothetical protein [Chloroflexota bacterium]